MHKFFADSGRISEDRILLEGPDVNHIRQVLRLGPGEEVLINDGQNARFRCIIEAIEKDRVSCRILERLEADTELPLQVTLFQGLPKQEKMELVIQKAVELGAHTIVPVRMRRSVVKLDEKSGAKKRERWQKIAEAAAKQSGRSVVPVVEEPMDFSRALELAGRLDLLLVPYENAEGMEHTRKVLEGSREAKSLGIFIGPEGGYDDREVEALGALEHAETITLGRRILRTETAGMALLAMLLYIHEQDDG
ncbi:16S rRNA (uracil(1498)-N(3))-methyltransferase [Anaerotalea alkaliphila]|uniref:Ribosomal RNA small subunit methyltransferase E n=1 Tax=Anaerotalea alkaliphila TaxID=2662126 RepID=A0A7X5HXB7_9FIRM|nr:16S rRNA (uracil(1498)-N(3))-methyltransferase [Anaerotalea alkaliphila]NDL68216.1 16S rRNA (uracil(1498)-N(3))-methyltransferase [Anaerotalea alkaliphila]